MGNVISAELSDGTVYYTTKHYQYDTAGNVLEEKTETQYQGDEATYETMRYDYDSNGNVICERQVSVGENHSGEERIVEYIYDAENRNIRIIRGLTAPLSDRSLTAVDALGNSSVYKYEYDEQGRLIKETDYEGRRTEYAEFDDTNTVQKIEKYTSDGVLYYTVTDDKTNGVTISGGDSTTEIKTKTEAIEGANGYENDSIIKNTVDAGGYIVSNIRDVKDEFKYEIVSVYDSNNKLVVKVMYTISDTNAKSVNYRKEYTYYESGLKHTFMVFDGNGDTLYGLRYKYNGGGVESMQEIHNRTTAPATDDTTISDYETYEYNGDNTLNVAGGVAPITSSYNNYFNDGKVY